MTSSCQHNGPQSSKHNKWQLCFITTTELREPQKPSSLWYVLVCFAQISIVSNHLKLSKDYGQKLHSVLTGMKDIMPTILDSLMSNTRCPTTPTRFFDLDVQTTYDAIISKRVIDTKANPTTALVIFNSLTRPRCEVCVMLNRLFPASGSHHCFQFTDNLCGS